MENNINMLQGGKARMRAKICRVRGKERAPIDIRDNIEVNHLNEVSLPATTEKIFRKRKDSLTEKLHS